MKGSYIDNITGKFTVTFLAVLNNNINTFIKVHKMAAP